uniref:Dynein regulatory complex subunit 7 n=1 Tax=Stegastes partitus TaxID=144197 RepID=A0A3B4ZE11_9TELE
MAAAPGLDSKVEIRNEEIQQSKEEEEASTELTELQLLVFPLLSFSSPESYRINSISEIRLLAIADNFQHQYSHLFPDRKLLLLCPVNECGVKKFVSTTVRPTTMVPPELLTWQGCALFVANFLTLEPLEPPVHLPRHLFSSTTVLKRQRATCFEFATLLCSLLLGSNYDAYCVSGYAIKEMCLLDQSLQECPLVISEQQQPKNKYTVKSLRELESRFLTQQAKKKQEAEVALLQKQKLQEESELRPADHLRGLRVHCWVLVLARSRRVKENFFIDPLTGNSYATDSDSFLGIESMWNNLNYYVNMQDCSNGCAEMVYDVEDLKMWEPMLYGATSKKELILTVQKKQERSLMSKSTNEEEVPNTCVFCQSHLHKLPALCCCLDMENRWPGGKTVIRYRKSKLERFAPGLSSVGLITRLTTYKDLECTEVALVKEWYQDRKDHLEEREVNKVDNFMTECFKCKTTVNLLRKCRSLTAGTEQEMEFSNARSDGLVRRKLTPHEMIETFEGRSDFLYYRHGCTPKQFDKASSPSKKARVVERFHRNKSKPANNDVAKRIFLVAQQQIELTYHLMDYRFSLSRRTFNISTSQKFKADMVCTFQTHKENVAEQIGKSVEEDEKQLQEQKKDILTSLLIQLGKEEDLSPKDAKKIYQDCLAEMRNRLQMKANLIQKCYEEETQRLQTKQQWYQKSQLHLSEQEKDNYQTYCFEKTLQISVIQKRLSKWKETANEKYTAFDQMLQKDPRLAPHLHSSSKHLSLC